MRAILINNEMGPAVVELRDEADDRLADLQRIVGGRIEALGFPYRNDATCYINDEGKFVAQANHMATAIMIPILMLGDAIHGPMLICGFDASTGETLTVADDLIDTYVTGVA